MIAGLILLAHAPARNQTWEKYDQFAGLGLDRAEFPDTHFAPKGTMHDVGLSTVGGSVDGATPIWEQDQSIMSWTGGYCVSSAIGIARFLAKLLMHKTLVSPANVARLEQVSDMIAASYYSYGFGLMHGYVGNTDNGWNPNPVASLDVGKFSGHHGMTYGFSSANGYFPFLNATLSAITNYDGDFFFARNVVVCPILEVIARHKGLGEVDLDCKPVTWVCDLDPNQNPQCLMQRSYSGGGMTKAGCARAAAANQSGVCRHQ